MKKILLGIIAITWLGAFHSNDNGKAFKKLHGLEGTWKMTTKRGAICEEWKKVDENYLQNRGYMIKGNDTIITERVALTNTRQGVFYTSTVEDQNAKQPIAFKMTKAEGHMYVFENPAHDFPKRIVYNLVTTDSIHAFIDDGTEAGRKQHFYFKKQ